MSSPISFVPSTESVLFVISDDFRRPRSRVSSPYFRKCSLRESDTSAGEGGIAARTAPNVEARQAVTLSCEAEQPASQPLLDSRSAQVLDRERMRRLEAPIPHPRRPRRRGGRQRPDV